MSHCPPTEPDHRTIAVQCDCSMAMMRGDVNRGLLQQRQHDESARQVRDSESPDSHTERAEPRRQTQCCDTLSPVLHANSTRDRCCWTRCGRCARRTKAIRSKPPGHHNLLNNDHIPPANHVHTSVKFTMSPCNQTNRNRLQRTWRHCGTTPESLNFTRMHTSAQPLVRSPCTCMTPWVRFSTAAPTTSPSSHSDFKNEVYADMAALTTCPICCIPTTPTFPQASHGMPNKFSTHPHLCTLPTWPSACGLSPLLPCACLSSPVARAPAAFSHCHIS